MGLVIDRRLGWGVAILFLLVLAGGALAVAQGFGAPTNFAPSVATDGQPISGSPGAGQASYFVHDQWAKLLVLLGFSVAAVAIVSFRGFRWRKPLLAASVVVLGFVLGGFLCPIAAVQNVVLKAGTAYLLLFLVPVLLALWFGRLFCGYVCPFGALQELLHVRRWRLRIPERWVRRVGIVKYFLLAYLVVRVLVVGTSTLRDLTPFKAFFTLGGTPVTVALSAAFVVASVFVFRPFCRVFCPLGALLALVSRFSVLRMRSGRACISCSQCERACPSGVMGRGTYRSDECLLCGACLRVCPADALSVSSHRHSS